MAGVPTLAANGSLWSCWFAKQAQGWIGIETLSATAKITGLVPVCKSAVRPRDFSTTSLITLAVAMTEGPFGTPMTMSAAKAETEKASAVATADPGHTGGRLHWISGLTKGISRKTPRFV
ncbi:MAG: hypothetical protein HC783_10210 [Rhodobacteraceae bacterium]|nr:hypothetical protein [Paracoccaceae bacterium]